MLGGGRPPSPTAFCPDAPSYRSQPPRGCRTSHFHDLPTTRPRDEPELAVHNRWNCEAQADEGLCFGGPERGGGVRP
jgi:hypothetical protein